MAAEGDTVFAAAGAASKAARGKPLAGQVAIVTGGGQGIGFGIATRLGELGAKLALFDMNEVRLLRWACAACPRGAATV